MFQVRQLPRNAHCSLQIRGDKVEVYEQRSDYRFDSSIRKYILFQTYTRSSPFFHVHHLYYFVVNLC